jgi:hypothetical protein
VSEINSVIIEDVRKTYLPGRSVHAWCRPMVPLRRLSGAVLPEHKRGLWGQLSGKSDSDFCRTKMLKAFSEIKMLGCSCHEIWEVRARPSE